MDSVVSLPAADSVPMTTPLQQSGSTPSRRPLWSALVWPLLVALAGCTPVQYAQQADKAAYKVVAQKQVQATGQTDPFGIAYRPFPAGVAGGGPNATTIPVGDAPPQVLNLDSCLEIAYRNNRLYQTTKEKLYTSALALANLRHLWSRLFGDINANGAIARTGDGPTEYEGNGNATANFAQQFANGGVLTLGAGLQAATDFLGIKDTTFGSLLSANFTQPLLRGAWHDFRYEPLYRAERNFAISILDYERFVQNFSVGIATAYYNVLQKLDQLENDQENLRRLEDTFKFVQAQMEGGMISRVQADQAEQDVLTARTRIELTRQAYQDALDQYKITLGLPIAVHIELDKEELARLSVLPIPFEENQAVDVALRTRPDVLTAYATLRDAKRDVEIAANQFLPQLDLILNAAAAGEEPRQPFETRFRKAERSVRLNLDYPLDQVDHRDEYRDSQIAADRTQRDLDEFLDTVRLEVRNSYRSLLQSERTYEIQKASVDLAVRRTSLALFEQKEGLASTRDVLDAEDALRASKNAMTDALVSYTNTRLVFLAKLGMISVDAQGKFHERNEPSYTDRLRYIATH